MRKQYYFQPSKKGFNAWDVDKLIELTKNLPVVFEKLDRIKELDSTYWYDDPNDSPTCRSVAEHARLIIEANTDYPIILSSDGKVMDGMHRICKALIEGKLVISAVRLTANPQPDYTDVFPDDLPY